MTKVALAGAVNLSPSPCNERLKRLERAGYISGYRAVINVRKLAPVTEVFVEITLQNHQAKHFQIFETAVRDIPEIVECTATGGGIDYMLKLVVRDVDAYQRLIDELLDAALGIERYFGYIATKPIKSAPVHISRLLGQ